jgi:NTP pyrophosphatase (non-canonical NTP hydrolase)
MRKDFIEVYKMFIDNYGIDSQMLMCIEEMSELTKELCKINRYKGTDKEKQILDNIREEIADVLNMAEQLEYYFGEEEVERVRKEKIDRFLNNNK